MTVTPALSAVTPDPAPGASEARAAGVRQRRPPAIPMDWVQILDVPISRVNQQEAMAILTEFVHSGEPHLVVTADASGVVIAA